MAMSDNDDIPFNRDFPLKPGVVEEVRPGVRRVLCNNPSPFTFTGTVSYIVGRGKVAIIDPGPDDEAHAAALLDAVQRRDRDAYLRHPHPPRPFAEHRADQGRDRRHGLCRGPASRLAAALREREAQPGIRRRPRFQARHQGRATATSVEGDGWALRGGGDARPHRQPSGVRLARAKIQLRRRSRDGLVDLDRGAARRLDDRLHGLAGTARRSATRICISPATARRSRRPALTSAS